MKHLGSVQAHRDFACRYDRAFSRNDRRVPLTEDVAVNAKTLVMVLAVREFEADVAENGRIAVELPAQHRLATLTPF
ncbi:MAG: hypothetical protein IJ138_02475 [Clostridia bacterium]|nr:hypothetical protein [Clostridia bacterium]